MNSNYQNLFAQSYWTFLEQFYPLSFYYNYQVNQMSNSLLNFQQITSRTFNNDPSIMQTSIEHFEHNQNNPHFTKSDLHNMSLKKTIHANMDEIVRDLRLENENYRKEINAYKNRLIEMHRNGGNPNQQNYMRELMQELTNKQQQNKELKKNYLNAITNLKETIEKNEILSKQVVKLTKKLKDSELNYSREQQVFHKSQNLISNLSITKSNYEIELVNMKDSLVILEKENKKINQTNQQYQEKLALISQQIERLRGMLEKSKKENEMLRFGIENEGLKTKKYQSQYNQQKTILERLRIQNRQLNNKASALSQQLREYHEKLSYKEAVLNDMKQGQGKVQKYIKQKEIYIKDLEQKLKEYEQSLQVMQQEYSKEKSLYLQERNAFSQERNAFIQQKNTYVQQIGKLRTRLNEQSTSSKEVSHKRQELQSQYERLMRNFNQLQRQYQANAQQKDLLLQELRNTQEARDAFSRQKQSLIREMDSIYRQKNELGKETQYLKSQLLRWQQKFKDTQLDFKRYQQKQRIITKQCQNKIQLINQQRISQLNVKVSELNQCKFQLAARINQINQLRGEVAGRSNELIKLKEENVSKSSIFDHSRKDFDEKMRQKNEIINEYKMKLTNYQKLMEQSRRQRDMIFQQKNLLALTLQKNQQAFDLKNIQLKNYSAKIEELSKAIRQHNQNIERKNFEIQNYKRVVNQTELVIRDKQFKLKDAQNRVNTAINQIQRLNRSLREKEGIIIDLSNRCKEYVKYSQEKDDQMNRLKNNSDIQKQNAQKMNLTLMYAEESKGNFQLFIKQIQRLNQLVLTKESQSKNLKLELNKLLQKIDVIAQQQLKILKAVELAYSSSSINNNEIKSQFNELKDFIGRANQHTNMTIKEVYQQTKNMSNIMHRNESGLREGNSQIQQKLSQANRLIAVKQGEILLLKKQLEQMRIKIKHFEGNTVHQQEIFQKILQLSRENANVREQLAHIATQRQFEVEEKNISITNLQSQVHKLEVLQGKELSEMKEYLNQKERNFQNTKEKYNKENEILRDKVIKLQGQMKERDIVLSDKERMIVELQHRLKSIESQVDQKMKDIEAIAQMLQENSSSIQQKSNGGKLLQNQNKKNHIEMYEKQIQKLQKILEIRQQQYLKNQESYEKMKNDLKRYKNAQQQLDSYQQQIIQASQQIQRLNVQKKLLQQKLKNVQGTVLYLQQGSTSRSARVLIELKAKNQALQKQIRVIYAKLRESEANLAMGKQKINQLIKEHYQIINQNSDNMKQIQHIQSLQKQHYQYSQRIFHLQNDLQKATTLSNEYKIQSNYLHSENEQLKIFLSSYEHKTGEVQREYQKLKEVYVNLNNQYSKLRLKNHQFQIELRKAQILQQKIQVLNGQINRLSNQNIDLNSQISSCKLALGDESTLSRRNEDLLTLIVILMAEVQTLRVRTQAQQNEIKSSRVLQLGRYKS